MTRPDPVQTATTERLTALSLPADQAAWANAGRAGALARLRAAGLPDRRDEYWKFTRPETLVQPLPPTAAVFDDSDESPLFGAVDRLRIVFVDGVFDPAASDDLSAEGLTIERLEDVARTDIHWARNLYGTLEQAGQTPVPRPLASLNTAFATDGVVIRVTGQVSRPVNLIYLHGSESSDATLHNLVRLEEGARLTLLENGPAAARFNQCTEVDIAKGAAFDHVRAQGRDHERRAVTHMFARLGANAAFRSFTLTVNGALTRNETVLSLTGDDALAHVAGAALGDGGFHHDDTVFVTHDAVNCESRQVFKKVLRHGATGVFQGKILVRPGAQKTDGYQISQSLLLDDDSRFLAKPELEIYADDVACSHGSTTGAIDEDALFYLCSRGVPRADAQDLLIMAFLGEAIEEIADEGLRDDLAERLRAWLLRRRDG